MPPQNSVFSKKQPKSPSVCEDFGKIFNLPVERIMPNQMQSRRIFDEDSILRLADSIRRYGILHPITVRTADSDGDLFEIIAGERRFRAVKLLGIRAIPAVIIKADKQKSAELAIIENIQRENLNIFEQAAAIATLIDAYGVTQEEIAAKLSASQSFVSNKLRILRLTLPEREKILAYGLSERHARALLRLEDAAARLSAIEHIFKRNLTVAAAEEYIDQLVSRVSAAKTPHPPRRVILKDIRIFYNTIDRAISIVKQAGINIESTRIEEGDSVCLTIRIPMDVSRETSVSGGR